MVDLGTWARREPDASLRGGSLVRTNLFISYRRHDTAGYAGRLHDELAERIGADRVFRDVANIEPGEDFAGAIEKAIGCCDILIAVIGTTWLAARDSSGRRRLDDANDYVRLEIATALGRDVRVIPVLVEGAIMPAPGDLPEDLRPLATRNAIELRDASWEADVGRLIQAIDRRLKTTARRRPRRWRAAALVGTVLMVPLALWQGRNWLKSQRGESPLSAVPPHGDLRRDPYRAAAGPAIPTGGGASVPLALPPVPRTILFGAGGDHVIYEILSERLEPPAGPERKLAVSIRMTNNSSYGQGFSADSFRLVENGTPRAPVGGPSEVLAGRTVKNGDFVFDAPEEGASAVLRITLWGATSEIRLGNLRRASSAAPVTRSIAEESRPLNAQIPFDSASYRISTATFVPYSDKTLLRLDVRMTNRERFGLNFWDDSFRLMVNGLPRAPVGGLSEVVEGESTKDGTVIFELPEVVPEVLVLKVTLAGKTTEFPFPRP